jgi:hypothetical protein
MREVNNPQSVECVRKIRPDDAESDTQKRFMMASTRILSHVIFLQLIIKRYWYLCWGSNSHKYQSALEQHHKGLTRFIFCFPLMNISLIWRLCLPKRYKAHKRGKRFHLEIHQLDITPSTLNQWVTPIWCCKTGGEKQTSDVRWGTRNEPTPETISASRSDDGFQYFPFPPDLAGACY